MKSPLEVKGKGNLKRLDWLFPSLYPLLKGRKAACVLGLALNEGTRLIKISVPPWLKTSESLTEFHWKARIKLYLCRVNTSQPYGTGNKRPLE